MSVGRLSAQERYKGQDRVIGALPHLLAAGHDAVFLIAGEGDDRDRLEALARTLGVAERVWTVAELLDAALSVAPQTPTETAPDRRRRFQVIEGGKP